MENIQRFLRPIVLSLALLVPATAAAQLPWVYCSNLPGCSAGGLGVYKEHFTQVLSQLLTRFDTYAYVLGALFIMIGATRILTSGFSEEGVSKGKTTITWAIVGIFIGRFAQEMNAMILAEANSVIGGELITAVIITLTGTILDLLEILLLSVVVFCGMRMVIHRGKEEEFNKAKEGLFWAAVGAVILHFTQLLIDAVRAL